MSSAIVPSLATPSIAVDSSRVATTENLQEAGEKFESLFIGMMLKSMRQAKLADNLFESDAQNQFRDMQDIKTSEAMAVHTPLGIGKAMTEFLSRTQPGLQDQSAPAPERSKE